MLGFNVSLRYSSLWINVAQMSLNGYAIWWNRKPKILINNRKGRKCNP